MPKNESQPKLQKEASSSANRKKSSKRVRTVATESEISFCAYFVLTGNVKQASLQAGYSAWWGYRLINEPRIQPILRELEKRKIDECWGTARETVCVTREFLDEQYIQRLTNMKTHEHSGDNAIVKMLELGYRRTGDIQPSKVNNQTNLNVTPKGTMAEIYKSKWLRDKEAEMASQFEAEARSGRKPNESDS